MIMTPTMICIVPTTQPTPIALGDLSVKMLMAITIPPHTIVTAPIMTRIEAINWIPKYRGVEALAGILLLPYVLCPFWKIVDFIGF